MRTVQTIRKNKKSLTSFGRTLRAGLVLTLAFLATACGSTNNKGLRNYAGKMKTPEYYKDFTDYENPKQSQPSAEAAEDNHDYFPPETFEPDSVTPDSATPSAVTPSFVTPSTVNPSTVSPQPAPVSSSAPAAPSAPDSTLPTSGQVSDQMHDTAPGPRTKITPSSNISVGPAMPAPISVIPKPPTRSSVEISVPTPGSTNSPTTPRRERRRPAPAASASPADQTVGTSPLKSGDCRLSDKPCFPIAGNAHFTDDFGARRSGGRRHAGNDIFAEKLTPVVAIADGIVDRADRSASDGSGHNAGRLSGNYIGINHGNGVRTLYIHLNNDSPGTNDGQGHGLMPNIQVGVHVKKGEIIGWVGNSGNAETTPTHLHFEMRVTNDQVAVKAGHKAAYFPVDPFTMLKEAEGNKLSYPRGYNY